MKEFMMIFIGADYAALGLSPEELQGRMGKWFAWGNKMEQARILRGGNTLTNEGLEEPTFISHVWCMTLILYYLIEPFQF